LILVTGATGYVGGRLLRVLETRGEQVRCLARRPEFLRSRSHPNTQIVQGDVLDPESLPPVLHQVSTAYYLVHSMASGRGYAEEDRRGAFAFAAAARQAGTERIIYLGGLGSEDELSPHLESRQEVGRILRDSGVPTIEFRASIVLGSGSLSFEIIRALVEKLPVMVTPRWVDTLTQPIGVEDLIAYLVAALELPATGNETYEIGGPDRASYGDLMREYANLRGLRRMMIRVPVLTPRLSSLWLALVSPIYARVGRELIAGLRNETVVRDGRALQDFPIQPRRIRQALQRALTNEDSTFAATRWSDALSAHRMEPGWGGIKFGSRLVDSRAARVKVTPEQAFRPVARIGGATGWYYANRLWRMRGLLDRFVGGPGMRRGRRESEAMIPGDTLDFWRVEAFEPNHLLRLRAEMRLPGRAWLQFEVTSQASGSLIRQTALFDPVGLTGLLYWYGLWAVHQIVFAGMLRGLVRAAEAEMSMPQLADRSKR
jgi:uncharacterized protein YbjT (DUF2867 family)